ncbi:avidin-related protein 1-like [Mobula birostris]|uniref:avidin-related protein 1-like n=1 Tax=Mobula birostris TaxID=1983395 RepID=UPI003B285834
MKFYPPVKGRDLRAAVTARSIPGAGVRINGGCRRVRAKGEEILVTFPIEAAAMVRLQLSRLTHSKTKQSLFSRWRRRAEISSKETSQRPRVSLILGAAMETPGPAVPLFLLALLLPGISAGRCNMTGIWWNDLGSFLYLSEAKDLSLNGRYQTAVEVAVGEAGADRQAPVFGIRHDGKEPTFSMSAAWAGGSITSWVGQCLVLEDGHQILKTMWLLRSPVSSLQDNWQSTRIGEDTFHRTAGDVLSKDQY